jgi:hypothetical protein
MVDNPQIETNNPETSIDEKHYKTEEMGAYDDLISFRDRASDWYLTDTEKRYPKLYLYKFESEISDKKFCCERFDCEPFPDEHDVGLKYGSGKYLACYVLPKTKNSIAKTNAWRFRTGLHYDEMIREQGKFKNNYTPNIQLQPVVQQPQISNLKPFLDLIQTFLPIIQPFINSNSNNSNSVLETQKLLSQLQIENYKNTNSLIQDITKENMKVVNELIVSKAADNTNFDIDSGNETVDLLAQYLPVIQQFIPMLLGPAGGLVGKTVKAMPEVQKITKDIIQLKRLVEFLDNQPNIGIEQVNKVLQTLKIKRPV